LGSQGTVCAGGRYDYLVEQLGGKPAPAVGWALGVDRVLELIKEQGMDSVQPVLDAYAIVPDLAVMPLVLQTLQTLRATGVSIQMHASANDGVTSMKSQFKRADSSGARHALIFGADEISKNQVTVKSLRDGSGAQTTQLLADIIDWAPTLQLPT
jgi:histidyl-tRNA synthetase